MMINDDNNNKIIIIIGTNSFIMFTALLKNSYHQDAA